MIQIEKHGWPFNSRGIGYTEDGFPMGDRDGGSEDLAGYFASYIGDGVVVFRGLDAEEDSLKCEIVPGSMTVLVNIGRISIRGRMRRLAEPVTLEIPRDAEAREYRIILRLSLDDTARNIVLMYTDGPLLRTSNVYDMQLAVLRTVGGAYTLDGAVLVDTREDAEVCGISRALGMEQYEPLRTLATQAEAVAGVSTIVRAWAPERVRRASRQAAAIGWTKIFEQASAGTFTFYPGNYGLVEGQTIGVFLIGGGGAGSALGARAQAYGSGDLGFLALGGASGRARCFLLKLTAAHISSGISGTVGAGGTVSPLTLSSTSSQSAAGATGATTSFAGNNLGGGSGGWTAAGLAIPTGIQAVYSAPVGGQVPDANIGTGLNALAPRGCQISAAAYANRSEPIHSLINWFDPFTPYVGAGATAIGLKEASGSVSTTTQATLGSRASMGSTVNGSLTVSAAAKAGEGGSSVLLLLASGTSLSGTLTAGAGAPGAVLIYV